MADPTPEGPDKLSLVVYSGDFDKVHYALVMASAAAAIGRPVTLFFTMWACEALRRPDPEGPDPEGPDPEGKGSPGWQAMAVPARGDNGAALDADFGARGVATFEDLLSACVAMGVRFMVCEMGLKAIGMDREALRDDVPVDVGGVVTFLNDASKNGAMLFI